LNANRLQVYHRGTGGVKRLEHEADLTVYSVEVNDTCNHTGTSYFALRRLSVAFCIARRPRIPAVEELLLLRAQGPVLSSIMIGKG
jgi:hypothetical protein